MKKKSGKKNMQNTKQSFLIKINPNGYSGNLYLNKSLNPIKDCKIEVTEGVHFLNTGASIGSWAEISSYIAFFIDAYGHIEKIVQTDSAMKQNDTTLKLLTEKIKIKINNSANPIYISAFKNKPLKDAEDLTLVKYQSYNIYTNGGGDVPLNLKSDFVFKVDKNGNVDSEDLIAASGKKKTLSIHTVEVSIDPKEFSSSSAGIELHGGLKITKKQKIRLVRGLLTYCNWNEKIDGKTIPLKKYFIPI